MQRTFNDFLNFVRPSEHSKYSPSSADRWLITGCPGSLKQCEGIPYESSPYAEEGTLAHSYCEGLIKQQFYGLPIPNDVVFRMAMLPDQGAEMQSCGAIYADIIHYWVNNKELIGDLIYWGLEKGVPVYPEWGCFGTADCIVVGTKGAAVIDFKYGKGRNVSATTSQLKVYAAGLASHIPINAGSSYPVHVVVHQPRTNHDAKEHTYSHQELMEFMSVISKSIQAAEQPNAELKDGNHCFWCPARRTKDLTKKCPVQMEKPIKIANENFDKFLADANIVSPNVQQKNKRDEAIIKLMALFPAIEAIVKDGKEEMTDRLKSGEAIPGLILKEEYGNRKINAENNDQAAMLIRQYFPQVNPLEVVPAKHKLRTITSLEKELGKNKLDPICIRPVTRAAQVMDDKTRAILDSMSQYAATIGVQR